MQQEQREEGQFVASLLFVALGIGYLFPFSALTNPVDYWDIIFPSYNILFPMSNIYMSCNLLVVFLLVFLGGTPNFTTRIVTGFVGQFIVLITVPTLYFFQFSENVNCFLVLLCTAIVAIFTACIDSCAISFAGQYPPVIQESLQLGIGYSTLIGSVYRIITKLAFPLSQVVISSFFYFYAAAATIFFCILAFYYLLEIPYSKKYLNKGNGDKNVSIQVSGMIASPQLHRMNSKSQSPRSRAKIALLQLKESGQYGSISSIDSGKDDDDSWESDLPNLKKIEILKTIVGLQMYVFTVFSVSLALWPSLVTEIPSFNFPYLQETRWWPLILLALYSVFDVIGRYCVPFRGYLNANNIGYIVVLRLLYFPILYCSVWSVIFTHDAWTIFFVSSLGFTTGYIGSLCIIMTNEEVRIEDRHIAGQFSGFFLVAGTVVGSSLALFLTKYIPAATRSHE